MSRARLPAERSRPYDVGVLFVHGIGQQRQGETLTACGEPLAECLQDLLARISVRLPEEPRRSCRAELTAVRIRDLESGEPAHAELVLHDIGPVRAADPPWRDANSRWLLAESWWADAFSQPSYRQILSWMLTTLPVTLVAHFDRQMRRSWFMLDNPDNLSSFLAKAIRLIRSVAALLGAIALLPLLLIVIAGVVLLGLLPIPVVDALAQKVQRLLAATIGDSYSLLNHPMARGSILARVRRDLAWLGGRCERIAVVAHSQGGAIAHEVFRSTPLAACDLLITYGSGLQKLALIERMKNEVAVRTHLLIGVAVASFTTVLVSLGRLAWVGWQEIGLWFLAVLGLALSCLSIAAWLRRVKRSFSFKEQSQVDQDRFNRRFRLPCERRMRWVDVIASDDPVSNGPLLDEYVPQQLDQHTVWNLGSLVHDHTTYWRNRDDFVSRLLCEMLRLAGIGAATVDPDLPASQVAASQRRRWRVAWRRAGWWTVVAATFAAGWRLWAASPAWASGWVRGLAGGVAEATGVGLWLTAPGAPPFHSPLAGLLGISLLVSLNTLFAWIWRWWDRQEMEVLFTPPTPAGEGFDVASYHGLSFRFAVYASALAACFVSALTFALTAAVQHSILVALLVAVAVVPLVLGLTDAAGWTRVFEGLRTGAAVGPLDRLRERWAAREHRLYRRMGRKTSRWSAFRVAVRQMETDPERGEETLLRAMSLGSADAARHLGWHHAEAGQIEAALAAFARGRELGDGLSAYELGRLYETGPSGVQDEACAVEAYRHALDLGEPLAAHCLGNLLRSRAERLRGRDVVEEGLEGAIKAYERGMDLHDSLSCLWLGHLYRDLAERPEGGEGPQKKHLESAFACYRRAMSLGETSAASELGRMLYERGDVPAAIRVLRQGARLGSAESAIRLGRLLAELDHPGEAAEALQRGLELARLRRAEGPRFVEAEAAWEFGSFLHARGERQAARDLYAFAVQAASGPEAKSQPAGRAAVRMGEILLQDSPWETDEAEAVFRRGQELGTATAGVRLASLLVRRGAHSEARQVLRDLKDEENRWRYQEDAADVWLGIGQAYEGVGDDDNARTAYKRAADLEPECGELPLVRLLVKRLDFEAAAEVATGQRVWSSEPAILLLGRLLMEGGRAAAVPVLLRGLDAEKACAETLLAAGQLLEQAGDAGAARWRYREAMERGCASAARRLGDLLKATGKVDEAEWAYRTMRILGTEEPRN